MDQHYSAFISYKHAPADIAAASEIQKRLERYHVPAAIRKKTGKDKIGRIFRDKEELPITSDLSEDIGRALEDADFLIVICSTATKASHWVPREIDYFLQHHSRKQVLTVLVDGEPGDVIPAQLLSETVMRTAPDGSSYEEEVTYEPLSCDFRTDIKEARKTEIPRLAAALLGCTYDELMMRERQYKRRRNLAIGIPAAFALAIAVGYLVWSRQEIAENYQRAEENYQLAQENYQLAQENYQQAEENYQQAQANLKQAMINQTTYLCTESARLRREGDRIRSILLALEALPSGEEDPRPLTPMAQTALVSALEAYRAPGSQLHYKRIKMAAEFAVNGAVQDFFPAVGGRFVIIRDSYGAVDVWDTASFQKVLTLDKEKIYDVQAFSDARLAVRTGTGIAVYDISSGRELWRYEDENVFFSLSSMRVAPEADRVWLALSRDGQYDGSSTHYSLTVAALEASAGKAIFMSDPVEGWTYHVSPQEMVCTEDGRLAALAANVSFGAGEEPSRLFLIDAENKELQEVLTGPRYYDIQAMKFPEHGRLVVSGRLMDDSEDKSMSFLGLNDSYALQHIAVSCFDTASREMLWETAYECYQHSLLKQGLGLGYARDSRLMVSTYANKACMIRLEDGVIEDEIEYSAPVVGIELGASGYSISCLNNGCIGIYDPESKGSDLEFQVFNYSNKGMLRFALPGEKTANYLMAPDSHKVWFCPPVEDGEFVRYEAAPIPENTFFRGQAQCRDTLAIMGSDNSLRLFDLSGQAADHVLELGGSALQFELLGTDEASGTFWIADSGDPDQFLRVGAADGSLQKYRSGYPSFFQPQLLENGKLVYWGRDSAYVLVTAEVKDGVLKETPLLSIERALISGFSVRADLKTAAIIVDNECYLADLGSGKITKYPEPLKENICQVVWGDPEDHAGFLAVTDGYEVRILKTDGTVAARLSETGAKVVSMTAYQGELIVLYGGGKLTRYAWPDGTLKGRTSISAYSMEYEVGHDDEAEWIFRDGRLYLFCRHYDLLQIIDLATWKEEACIQDGIAYDAARDRIICGGKDDATSETCIGYYPHYTVEDLRRKAQEALHGAKLTQEERAMYGLTED